MLLPSSRTGAIDAQRLMTNKAEPVPLPGAMGACCGVTAGFAFLFIANPAAAILSRPRGNPAVLGNESVRPEALRPRLSASLPLERFDIPLRSGDKSSGLVAFSRHCIWRRVA